MDLDMLQLIQSIEDEQNEGLEMEEPRRTNDVEQWLSYD